MSLEQTWRWFGPDDPVSLSEIRQTGATGIVTALHHIPIGSVWTLDEIMKRKDLIESRGLSWSVAESLPVHEAIKQRSGNYRMLIDQYKQSIRNLGHCGIDTVCYNFMPVLDWSRTDLEFKHDDGSITTRFEDGVMAAFDLHILRRRRAEDDYPKEQVQEATRYFESLNETQRDRLQQTVLLGFPGSWEAYSLEKLRAALDAYQDIHESALRDSLISFLKEIIPVAEESGVRLAIHPDDPPWPLLGLPRIVSTKSHIGRLLEAVDSPANGLTLCTGSLGAGEENNLVDIASTFARRIHFAHLRNVIRTGPRDFNESDHLEGVVDLYGVMKTLVLEQQRRMDEGRTNRRLPFRPDHGRLTVADKLLEEKKGQAVYPGYSLFGRLRAMAELRGLEVGIRRSLSL